MSSVIESRAADVGHVDGLVAELLGTLDPPHGGVERSSCADERAEGHGAAKPTPRRGWFPAPAKWVSARRVADDEPIAPEEDPEAALEALAEGSAPESPARRRRLARAALFAVRDARRSARIGIGLGVAAVLLALGVGVLALSRDGDDDAPRSQRR